MNVLSAIFSKPGVSSKSEHHPNGVVDYGNIDYAFQNHVQIRISDGDGDDEPQICSKCRLGSIKYLWHGATKVYVPPFHPVQILNRWKAHLS